MHKCFISVTQTTAMIYKLLTNSSLVCAWHVAARELEAVQPTSWQWVRTHSTCPCLPVTWKQSCTTNICCAIQTTQTPTKFKTSKYLIKCESCEEAKPLKMVCRPSWNYLANMSLISLYLRNGRFQIADMLEAVSVNPNQLLPLLFTFDSFFLQMFIIMSTLN